MHLASRSGLVVGVAHALLALLVRGGEGTWIPTAGVDQNWPAAANWSGIDAFPWLLDDSAALTSDLAAPQTVNLGGAWTVGTLLIGDPVAPWHPFTLGPTAALYLNVTEGTTRIEKTHGGADLIAAPITYYDDLVIVNNQNDVNQPLRFSGIFTQSGTRSITVSGAGPNATVEFAYGISSSGGMILNSGRIRARRYTTALGSGSFIMNGGTLELIDNNNLSFSRPTIVNSNATIFIDRETDGPWGRFTMGTLSIGGQTLSVGAGGHVMAGDGERGFQELVFGATTLREPGAVFDIGADTHLTLGAIDGNHTFTKQGSGRLDLASSSTRVLGDTILEGGTLRLRTAAALGAGSTLNTLRLNGGLLSLMGGATTYNSTVTELGDDMIIETGPAYNSAGTIHSLNALLPGGHTLTIRNNPHVANYPGSTAGTYGLTAGSTMLDGAAVVDIRDVSPTASTFNPTFPQGRFTPGVLGGGGSLTKTGSGTMYLDAANTNTGPITVGGGTLRAVHASAFGTADGGTIVTPGGMIDLALAVTPTTYAEPLTLSGTGMGGQGALVSKGNYLYNLTGPVVLDGHVRVGAYGNTTAARPLTFSGPITGTNAAFEKVGIAAAGVLLSGANTFTGTTTVTAGKLQLGYATENNSKLDDASNLILAGGQLDLAGGSHTEVVAGTILKTGESSVTRASVSSTLKMNTITRNPGAFLNIGAASIASTDNLNVNGILGGWATIGSGWAINSTGGADAPITALATYKTTDESTWTSTDNVKATAARTLTADRQVNSLFLGSTHNHNIGVGQTLRIENGGLLVGGNYSPSLQNGTLTAGVGDDTPGELVVSHNGSVGYILTIGSTIADNGSGPVSLSKNRAGTLRLSGANTYSGNTYLNAGKLILDHNNALGDGTGTLRIGHGTTIDSTVGDVVLAGNPQVWEGDFTFTGTTNLDLGTGPVSLGSVPSGTAPFSSRVITFASTAANKKLTLRGPISGDFGLTKAANYGILELGGANTYSGDTYNKSAAVAAPIKLIANEVIPNGPGKGNFCLYGNNTVLDLNGFNETINGLANNGTTFVDNTAPDTTSTLTFGDNNFSGWYSGKFRDTGSGATLNLVKTGSGIMILSGVNEHSGTTTINEGTLRLGGATALGTVDGGTIVNAGGALDLNDFALTLQEPLLLNGGVLTNRAGSATWAGPVTISGSGNVIDVGLTDIILSGTLSGSGSVVKQAYGALYLNGDDSAFTGALDIQGGWVRLNATGLGASANPVTVRSGAYLDLYGGFLETRPVTICGFGYNYTGALRNNHATLDSTVSGPVTLAGDAGIFVNTAARKLTLDGKLSGDYGFEKIGAGILVLGNTGNDYAGDSTVRAGTLRLGAANVIPDGAGKGDLNLITTLDLNGYSETVNGLNGQGGVTCSSAGTVTLTVGANNANGAYYGNIVNGSGTVGLTKVGNGVLTLGSSSSTFTGPTRIEGGTLRATVDGDCMGGNAGILVFAGGDLELANDASLTITKRNTEVLADTTITTDRLRSAGDGVYFTMGTMAIGDNTIDVKGGVLVTNGLAEVRYGAVTLSGSPTFNVIDPPAGGGTRLTLGGATGAGDLHLRNNGATANGIIITGTVDPAGRIINEGTGSGSTLISGVIGPNVTAVLQESTNSVLTLGGDNTFTCGLVVKSNTTVRIANATDTGATGSGEVLIQAGGTVDGNGTMAGTVNLAPGGTLSPAINDRAAAGMLMMGNLNWQGGGIFDCVVTKIAGAAPGVDHGTLYVDGQLSALPNGTNLIIRLDTLEQTFVCDPNINYGLKLISFGTEGMATNLNLAAVSLDTSAFLVDGGGWTLTNIMNTIYLVNAVTAPDPEVNIWIADGYNLTSGWDYWGNSNNWSLGHVPLPGESVLFDYYSTKECRIDEIASSIGSLTLAPGYGNNLVFWSRYPGQGLYSNVLVTGDVLVESGNLAHWDHGTGGAEAVNRLMLTVDGNFTLGPNASINLDGLGYRAGFGPGAGNGGIAAAGYSASHGGAGANNLTGKTTYGSITQPESLGSGAAGAGGGALFLRVGGTATIDGLVSSRGLGGTATTCAGAGGSIFIQAANVAGSGTIRAGANTDTPAYYGSGGGRIAVIATNGTTLGSLTIMANTHPEARNGGGRAGTVYLETAAFKRLIIDQENIGTASSNFTDLPAPTESFATLPALGGSLEDVELILTNNAFVQLGVDLRMGGLPWMDGELALNGRTLYLKAATPAGTFPDDYGAGTVTLPGVVITFANGDSLTRDGRLLWGDEGTTWRVITMVYNDSGGTATNKGQVNEGYIAHGTPLELVAITNTMAFRFWDGSIPDGKPSSVDNPLIITSLESHSAFRAWFAEPIEDTTYLNWLPSAVSDDWFAPYNWDLLMVPTAGQVVTIPAGSAVRLGDATPTMSSCTIASGATLTFDGWNSSLSATTLMVSGRVTHLPQSVTEPNELGEWVPQHRIWLKGNNLMVAAGGMLDADGMGYLPGAGPGAAPAQGGDGNDGTGYNVGGGGGYGGSGAACQSQMRGEAYGVPDDPWQPGSGGGYRPAYFGINAKPAGGAIRIEMTGAVTVDGLVTACGLSPTATGTAGSGGGIAIYCQTFAGSTSGCIRANGGIGTSNTGTGNGGSGGGGRIALHYSPAAQAALPVPRPPVRLSTSALLHATPEPELSGTTVLPVMGTLYIPDTTLLAASPTGPVVLDDHRFWYTRLYIGSHPSSWSPASLTIENCLIGFPENFSLQVGGNLTLSGTRAPLDGVERAGLHLFATNSVDLYGSQLWVGGDFTIGADTWFRPHTDGHSPAIVGVRVGGAFHVAAGGGVNANMDGYLPDPGNTNGPGASLAGRTGGSYGGWGGVTNLTSMVTNGIARPPYGQAEIPLEAGSPGAWRFYGNYTGAGRGGGAIHVLARGPMNIDGTLTANGGKGAYHEGYGGSGGSILLSCLRLRGTGTLQARGGARYSSSANHGGGGRIAVWQFVPLPGAVNRVADRDVGRLTREETLRGFDGTVDVGAGGPGDGATDGTTAYMISRTSMLILR